MHILGRGRLKGHNVHVIWKNETDMKASIMEHSWEEKWKKWIMCKIDQIYKTKQKYRRITVVMYASTEVMRNKTYMPIQAFDNDVVTYN